MRSRAGVFGRWAEVVRTAGLAALIAAIGGYVGELSRGAQSGRQGRCEIAAGVEDDTPNPAPAADKQRRIAYIAAQALERCLSE